MQKKYRNKGVILLAISYEGENKVEEYVKKENIKYIVGADAQSTTDDFGVKGWPAAFLIDPDGKIAWKGHPGGIDKPLKDLLKEKPPKGKGFLAAKSAKAAYKAADKLYKKKKYEDALDTYKDVARNFPGSKESKKAKKKIRKMRGNSNIMEKIRMAKAERQAERWLLVARTLAENGDAKDAVKYYKRILRKYPNTQSAKFAQSEYRDLQDEDEDEDEDEDDEVEEDEDEDDDDDDD